MGPVPQPEEDRDHPNHDHGNNIEDAEHPDVIINVDISDSDDDDDEDDDIHGGYIGYQALAQDGSMVNQDSDSDDNSEAEVTVQNEDTQNTVDSSQGDVACSVPEGLVHQYRHPDFPNTANIPGYMQVPDLPKPEKKDMLWNQHRQTDSPLETDHADKILSVMSNIQLPSSHIPDWAQNLSEDQWQVQVVNKLVKHKNSSKNSDVSKGTSQNENENNVTSQTSNVSKGTSQYENENNVTSQTSDVSEQSCQGDMAEECQDVNVDKLATQ